MKSQLEELAKRLVRHAAGEANELEDDLLEAAAVIRELLAHCAGVGDSKCNYLGHCGQVCNKCGRIHDGQRTTFVREEAARAAPAEPEKENSAFGAYLRGEK